MGVNVYTGATTADADVLLNSHNLTSAGGERVLFVLHVRGATSDTASLEREALAIIEHALLHSNGAADARLDGALKELNGLTKGFLMSGSITDVHALLGIITDDNVLHISHAGTAEAYLVRGGSASQITEYSTGKPDSSFVHIASGHLHPRDVVLLSTQRLLRAFTPAQLSQAAHNPADLPVAITDALQSEKEEASIAILELEGDATAVIDEPQTVASRSSGRARVRAKSTPILSSAMEYVQSHSGKSANVLQGVFANVRSAVTSWVQNFRRDLNDPKRKRRAHLLLLAGSMTVILLVLLLFNLTRSSQRNQTRQELETIIEEIKSEVESASNRHLSGDIDEANHLLRLSEEKTKQVMNNEAGLFRNEAYDLLDTIRLKYEEINNIIRLSPRVVVNLASQNPNVSAQGFTGLGDGEFIVYDRLDSYRVLLNTIDQPDRITDEEFILNAANFQRYGTIVYQTTDNGIIETINDQPTSMKTEDPAGWITGKDIETYLRYLYVLSPENNQVYKYERLSNRYGSPSEYNVNGDLRGAIDIAIDGNIYVLKEGGEMLSLLRGEVQPFIIRRMPEDTIGTAVKMFKVVDGNFYLLDPEHSRVLVLSAEDDNGESSYMRQYVLEGEKVGTLADVYVNADETQLHVLDEKRVYVIDLDAR